MFRAPSPALRLTLCALGAALSLPVWAVDWSQVPEKEVLLVYPGQSSWEVMLTPTDHEGAQKFRGGKNCKDCHEGEQQKLGAKIVKGGKFEPSPPAGKPGHLALKVQTAHDADKLYFRFRYKPGSSGGSMDPKVAARVAVMIGDSANKEAVRAGCWGTCHDDAAGMASAAGANREKYLGASRVKLSRTGGGDGLKPAADLDALLAGGQALELWSADLNPGQPAVAHHSYVLAERHEISPATLAAEASFANGEWTVVLSRPLKSGGKGQKDLAAGKTYAIGFAVHDDHALGRFHHVSYEQSLALDGGSADFVAKKQ